MRCHGTAWCNHREGLLWGEKGAPSPPERSFTEKAELPSPAAHLQLLATNPHPSTPPQQLGPTTTSGPHLSSQQLHLLMNSAIAKPSDTSRASILNFAGARDAVDHPALGARSSQGHQDHVPSSSHHCACSFSAPFPASPPRFPISIGIYQVS